MKKQPMKQKSFLGFRGVFLTLALALALIACVDGPPSKQTPKSSNLDSNKKMDPTSAQVVVQAAAKKLDGIANGDVPVLTLTYQGADSAKVFRCSSRYVLVYGNGIDKLSDLPKSSPDYAWAAKDAFERIGGNSSSCSLIAPATSGATITDFAAKSGSFYYVINPCVSSETSTSGRQGCSNKIEVTPTIEYTNTRLDAEIRVLQTMYSVEGQLYGNFNAMRRAIEEANEAQVNCVLQEAARRAYQQQLFGLIKLVTTIATPVIFGVTSGVGTALTGAVNSLLTMATPKQMTQQPECPQAKVKVDFYDQLAAKTQSLAADVLTARQELFQLDSHYANVEKEIAQLKAANYK
ncbi:hypothetical protein EBU99_02325 [bacterium]|nr:hypothetical protein [bacterium]